MGRTLDTGPLTDEQRDLAAQHFLLAMSIANRWIKRCSINHWRNELTSAAHMGLVEAARAHKPGHSQPFKALVRKCVDNKIVDVLRNQDRWRRRQKRFVSSLELPRAWYHPPLADEELLPSWLELLPEIQRDVIWLRYGLNMKPKEIAKHLGCHEKCVKTRLYRGLAAIRKFLSDS